MYSDIENISAAGIYGPPVLDTDYANPIKAIWLSSEGNVAFVGANQSNALVLPAVPANVWVPLNAKRINTSGTAGTIAMVIYSRPSQNR